jgi:hypothetical protein
MTFDEACDRCKSTTATESVLILAGGHRMAANLCRVVLAWQHVTPGRKDADSFSDGPEAWKELWDAIVIDWAELESMTGLQRTQLQMCFDVVKGNRLIYPDGTIATIAKSALAKIAKQKLGL